MIPLLCRSIWLQCMVFIRLILDDLAFLLLFFSSASFILSLLNIFIFPYTSIRLVFISRKKHYTFNDASVLKLYSILTRTLLFYLLSKFTNVCIYIALVFKSIYKSKPYWGNEIKNDLQNLPQKNKQRTRETDVQQERSCEETNMECNY